MIFPDISLQRRTPAVLFLFTVLSRLPFISKYLYHLDSGQFALALDHYDLLLHQPHPPGYFLYVMTGRLAHLLVSDPNTALILPAILFSALAVVAVYHLASEMYDERVGILAALLTATSPNLWFHGEVALSYSADALFSALSGLLCWRTFRGAGGSALTSASVLALAGGFRQNAPAFLLPLWIYSVRKEPFRTVCVSLALFIAISLAWFLPMVIMTGGPDAYLAAFRELWQFNTGHNSVFEKGIGHLKVNLLYLHTFSFYTLGAALPFAPAALYVLIRSGRLRILKDDRARFLAVWMLPSLLFYLLVFISGNPGYILIIMPPIVIITSASICFIISNLRKITGRDFQYPLLISLVSINSLLFLLGGLPVSRAEISTHDADIQALVGRLSRLDHSTTALFIGADSFYSYRHLMVYLPRFTVYQVDMRTGPNGERRRQFCGTGGRTFLATSIVPPKGVRFFAAVIDENARNHPPVPAEFQTVRVARNLVIVSGPVAGVQKIYPGLPLQWNQPNRAL